MIKELKTSSKEKVHSVNQRKDEYTKGEILIFKMAEGPLGGSVG